MAEFCQSPVRERCLELGRLCEIAVVNASAPECTGIPKQKRVEFTGIIVNAESLLDESIHEAEETGSQDEMAKVGGNREIRRSMSEGQISAHKAKDVSGFLEKKKRSELFTSQLDLFLQLEIISKKLVELPKDKRAEILQKHLAVLDFKISGSGLYFPNRRGSDPHYRILRIVSEEARPLSSRDKVPFLLWIEVAYTGKTCAHAKLFESAIGKETLLEIPVENSLPKRKSRRTVSASSSNSAKVRPSTKLGNPFGELLAEKRLRLQRKSTFASEPGWDILPLIVKVGDDCRQEQLAMQMIMQINDIFLDAKLPLKLRPFHVLVTSSITGVIEVITDATSIDSLKKNVPNFQSLMWFFEKYFGPRGSKEFRIAQQNFVESMAAYSLVTYLLQIKDRHNGNILLDAEGNIIHIDFGFFLSNSPGGNWGFEQAPFKLTQEYVEVMEGEDSEAFSLFKVLIIRGFLELRRHVDKIVGLATVLLNGPTMPCFYSGTDAVENLRTRFFADKTEQECIHFIHSLIEESVDNWRSVEYDRYQRITNGIL